MYVAATYILWHMKYNPCSLVGLIRLLRLARRPRMKRLQIVLKEGVALAGSGRACSN